MTDSFARGPETMGDVFRCGANCGDARRLSIAVDIQLKRNLRIGDAAINCVQVARTIVMVPLRRTISYKPWRTRSPRGPIIRTGTRRAKCRAVCQWLRTAALHMQTASRHHRWAGSEVLWLLGYQLEPVRHSAELRERTCVHLPHRPAAVDLHGGLGDADIAGNLLADAATRDLNHDFALARAQRPEARLEGGQSEVVLPPGTIAREAELNGVQEVLIAEGLGQELDGAALHGLHRHRNVAVPGDEDDREVPAGRGELALKIKAALLWKPDIEHQAGGTIRRVGCKEVGDGRKQLGIQAYRSQQTRDRRSHIGIVVDDQNGRVCVRHRGWLPIKELLGWTFVSLRHLIEVGHTIPSILVTAYPGDVKRILDDGIICCLAKPVDQARLLQCLRAALRPEEPSEGNL